MALEILGVVVDQIEKIRHQFAERQLTAEARHDGEQTGAAPGKDSQALNCLRSVVLTGDRPPQGRTVIGVQGAECQRPEKVIEGAVPLVDLIKAAGCARHEEKPPVRLKRLTHSPSRIVVRNVLEHHVQVLDDHYEASTLTI